jgi:hypothetical protein
LHAIAARNLQACILQSRVRALYRLKKISASPAPHPHRTSLSFTRRFSALRPIRRAARSQHCSPRHHLPSLPSRPESRQRPKRDSITQNVSTSPNPIRCCPPSSRHTTPHVSCPKRASRRGREARRSPPNREIVLSASRPKKQKLPRERNEERETQANAPRHSKRTRKE